MDEVLGERDGKGDDACGSARICLVVSLAKSKAFFAASSIAGVSPEAAGLTARLELSTGSAITVLLAERPERADRAGRSMKGRLVQFAEPQSHRFVSHCIEKKR